MKPLSRDLNTLVDVILLSGLALSVTLILAGLGWQWISTGSVGFFPSISSHNLLEYMLYVLRNITVAEMGPAALVNGGIAALLLTPFFRVLASVLYFGFRERNRIYTVITGFVLIVLAIVLFAV
jgi:uncharacterized membrane protein